MRGTDGVRGQIGGPHPRPQGKGSFALAMVLKLRSSFEGKPGDTREKRGMWLGLSEFLY